MFFFAGIHAKILDLGEASCGCPSCGGAPLRIILRCLTPHVFLIPTIRIRRGYTAVCPRCAGVFELDIEVGRAFERDPETPIRRENLRQGRRYGPSHKKKEPVG